MLYLATTGLQTLTFVVSYHPYVIGSEKWTINSISTITKVMERVSLLVRCFTKC